MTKPIIVDMARGDVALVTFDAKRRACVIARAPNRKELRKCASYPR